MGPVNKNRPAVKAPDNIPKPPSEQFGKRSDAQAAAARPDLPVVCASRGCASDTRPFDGSMPEARQIEDALSYVVSSESDLERPGVIELFHEHITILCVALGAYEKAGGTVAADVSAELIKLVMFPLRKDVDRRLLAERLREVFLPYA
jgi:hypothetical protein